jgi:hypothetical protein
MPEKESSWIRRFRSREGESREEVLARMRKRLPLLKEQGKVVADAAWKGDKDSG